MRIPDWVEAQMTLDFISEKAQRIHRSIFEMVISDLTLLEVNKPGFLGHNELFMSSFEAASDKHYYLTT